MPLDVIDLVEQHLIFSSIIFQREMAVTMKKYEDESQQHYRSGDFRRVCVSLLTYFYDNKVHNIYLCHLLLR